MMSHRTEDGGKRAKKPEFGGMAHATSQLLKTQDAGYLRTMIQSTRRARERVAEELTLQRAQEDLNGHGEQVAAKAAGERKHVVFVDDRADQKAYQPMHRRPATRTSGADLDDDDDDEMPDDEEFEEEEAHSKQANHASMEDPEQNEHRRKTIASQQRKLEALHMREKALVEAEQELELQRARMNHSIGGVTKAGHKFKIKERKK
jgi:U3 small nucleolar RNA-associated protein 11